MTNLKWREITRKRTDGLLPKLTCRDKSQFLFCSQQKQALTAAAAAAAAILHAPSRTTTTMMPQEGQSRKACRPRSTAAWTDTVLVRLPLSCYENLLEQALRDNHLPFDPADNRLHYL